ncbi:MAG: PmoA family protein [Planctomycetota bacterium]
MPHCSLLPLSGHQLAFLIDDREVLRWHAGTDYPRPFFFPVMGPSGDSLTRMGHPGAPDHDHHQSLWFAHNKVLGIDFWGNASGAVIRQQQWFAYEDGEGSCRMAVELGWYDGHNPAPLIHQELICELVPRSAEGEYTLELQSRFQPLSASLEFAKTNFGFLAVRVSASLSAVFGSGVLTSSEGAVGEKQVFGKVARWMDYSGPPRRSATDWEGLTLIDHPQNPGQPTGWHVRDDGWMCASPCMQAPQITQPDAPLLLRYLLLVHAGPVDSGRTDRLQTAFSASAPLQLQKSTRPHRRWELQRAV